MTRAAIVVLAVALVGCREKAARPAPHLVADNTVKSEHLLLEAKPVQISINWAAVMGMIPHGCLIAAPRADSIPNGYVMRVSEGADRPPYYWCDPKWSKP